MSDETDIVARLLAREVIDAADEFARLRAVVDEWKERAEKAEELADKFKWQVRDTCARAEKAEAALSESEAIYDAVFASWAESRARHLKAEAELAQARKALEPFAQFDTEDWPDSMRLFEDDPSLTMGNMRAARAALAAKDTP